MNSVISRDLNECEYKWVNYMDEVLELWQDLSLWVSDILIEEAVQELLGC